MKKLSSLKERFDEEFYSNPDTNGDLVIQWKIGDAENTKNTLMDFIEQELKKEREEKDQEHKAELEMIKGEIESKSDNFWGKDSKKIIRTEEALSILDSHINKL